MKEIAINYFKTVKNVKNIIKTVKINCHIPCNIVCMKLLKTDKHCIKNIKNSTETVKTVLNL